MSILTATPVKSYGPTNARFWYLRGGGAKGLAHLGALSAVEEAGIQFAGVAGTSAGAIVAALVASGYRAKELYDPNSDKGLFQKKNFLDFLNQTHLLGLEQLKAELTDRPLGERGWIDRYLLYRRYKSLIKAVVEHRGLFETDEFRKWLNEKIDRKTGVNETRFGDLRTDKSGQRPETLKIIATDHENGRPKLFGTVETPDVVIADAVAASIAIPFFFRPRTVTDVSLIDGGVVSNFPAWVFDKERAKAPDVLTFGFRLVQSVKQVTDESSSDPADGESVRADKSVPLPNSPEGLLFEFGLQVLSSCLSGNSFLHMRQIEHLHVVPIPVSIGTLSLAFKSNDSKRAFL